MMVLETLLLPRMTKGRKVQGVDFVSALLQGSNKHWPRESLIIDTDIPGYRKSATQTLSPLSAFVTIGERATNDATNLRAIS